MYAGRTSPLAGGRIWDPHLHIHTPGSNPAAPRSDPDAIDGGYVSAFQNFRWVLPYRPPHPMAPFDGRTAHRRLARPWRPLPTRTAVQGPQRVLAGSAVSVDDGLLRWGKLNGTGGVLKASKHNKRQLSSHPSADPARSHLNYALRGPSTAEEVAALARQLMADAGIHKLKRKDAVTAIEFVSSLPKGSTIDPKSYFAEFVAFIENRYGAHNILSADVHMDEPALHCHILMLPLEGGKLAGSSIAGGRQKFNELHTALHAEVAEKHGLRRPPPKLSGNARASAANQVLDALRQTGDIVMRSPVWGVTRKDIERYPDPYMAALGIQPATSHKPAKTFEQIATSTGTGPKTAAAEAHRDRRLSRQTSNPIEIDASGAHQSLSCVEIAQFAGDSSVSADHRQQGEACSTADATETPEHHPPRPVSPEAQPAPPAYTRIRDADLDPADFDRDTGEHITPPAPVRSEKPHPQSWLAARPSSPQAPGA